MLLSAEAMAGWAAAAAAATTRGGRGGGYVVRDEKRCVCSSSNIKIRTVDTAGNAGAAADSVEGDVFLDLVRHAPRVVRLE